MKIVNQKEFNELKNNGYVLVDFYADWCGPCKSLGPILEEVSQEVNDVQIVKVNVDNDPELAKEFKVMSIPAVFLLKDGNSVGSFVGLKSKEDVLSFINSHK